MISLFRKIVDYLTYGRLISCQIRIRFSNRELTKAVIGHYFDQMNVRIEDVEFHTKIENGMTEYSNVYTLRMPRWVNSKNMLDHLSSLTGVLQVDMKAS